MTAAGLLEELRRLKVKVSVEGQDLRLCAPKGILTAAILESVAEQKTALVTILSGKTAQPAQPAQGDQSFKPTNELAPALRRLEAVIDEVAAVWNSLPAPGGDRPWLNKGVEERLDNAINDRFRAADAAGALAAIENWRAAWLAILPVQPGDQQRDWLAVESEVLGGEVIVFVRDDETPVPEPYAGAVRYTLAELEPLQGLDADSLRAVHAAKKAMGGQVVGGKDDCAKAMVEESDGRRPTRRPHARELFQLKDIPGLSDAELLRRLNNPKIPIREWQA